jgi:hypothetical protein
VTVSDYPSGSPTITYTRRINGTVSSVPATANFSAPPLSGRCSEPVASTFGNRTGARKHQLLSHRS